MCALIMHECQLTACLWLWLNDGLAPCECTVTMADLIGLQPQQQQSVCGPTTHAATHTMWPSGLLMVYAMLTLVVKVWLFGMIHV